METIESLELKMNERFNKMGSAFMDLKGQVDKPERRYFVAQHASDSTELIDAVHALALAELKNVERLSTANRSTYAKIEHCAASINPVLGKFGLSIKQIITYNEHGEDILITRLSHKGQWYESRALLRAEKSNSQSSNQQFGSSITYMRRYALLAIIGIGQTDDPTDVDR